MTTFVKNKKRYKMLTAREFTDKLFESFYNNEENEKEMFFGIRIKY